MTPCTSLGYTINDLFELTCDDGDFNIGCIIRLIKDDGTTFPRFEYVSGPKESHAAAREYVDLDDIKPYTAVAPAPHAPAMPPRVKTPCEAKGYEIGDVFEVNCDKGAFKRGEIVALAVDDGTKSPGFRLCLTEDSRVMYSLLSYMTPHKHGITKSRRISKREMAEQTADNFLQARGLVSEVFCKDAADKLLGTSETAKILAEAFVIARKGSGPQEGYFLARVTFAMRRPVHANKGPVPIGIRRRIAKHITDNYTEFQGKVVRKPSPRPPVTSTITINGTPEMNEAQIREVMDNIKRTFITPHMGSALSGFRMPTALIREHQQAVRQSPHRASRAFDFKLKTEEAFGINQHQSRLLRSLTFSNCPRNPVFDSLFNSKPTQEEKKRITIKKVTYVNGTDILDLSDASVFRMIADEEAVIKTLEEIESKPKSLVADIKARKDGIAALIKLVDAK